MVCSGCVKKPDRSNWQNRTNRIHESNFSKADDNLVRWFSGESPMKIKGVAMVIHGLNLRPDKMAPMISLLTHLNLDVLNVSLRGHGSNYLHTRGKDGVMARLEAFKAVSYEIWMDETYRAYRLAKRRSEKENVPLVFLGYSLGGLLGADLFASHSDVGFDKMILFAPAFDLYAVSYVLKLLSPFPSLVIPSFSSRSYLSNYGTPMAAYNSLFDAIEHLKNNLSVKLNVPTIVFIDPHDELVSYPGLKEMVKDRCLDQWKFHLVQKQKKGMKVKLRHLIIDEASVGKDTWNEMKHVITNHLMS